LGRYGFHNQKQKAKKMMDIEKLATELTDDPLGRGYAGMTDQEAADDLNTEYRTKPKPTITGDEAFTATDAGEFATLTDHQRVLWMAFTGKDAINPFHAVNVALVDWIFGDDSTTVANLAVIRVTPCSRAVELGLGIVRPGHVENARY
jgi:hypothetical protein